MKKEKSDQNAVAELTREWLYKENKWLWEENKKLKEKVETLELWLDNKEKVNKSLREENEYLHKLLPEADGYIIEKQLEQRLWNDGEEDVYEDWWE